MVVDETAKVAAIVDAPQDTTSLLLGLARENGWDVQYLILTHGHWDHISDHLVVTEAFPKAKVIMHPVEEPKLQRPGSEIFDLPYEISLRNADGYLGDGDKIHIGSIVLAAMHTPGHSAGHIVLYSNEHHVLFAGDLIMAGAVGRYDLSDGNVELLKKSLKRIMLLPDSTRVLSGHGPATTIGNERHGNPFIHEWGLGETG